VRRGPTLTARMLSSFHQVCTTASLPQQQIQLQNTMYKPDQRVHFGRLHIPQLFHRILDLSFVRFDVNKEYKRVVFFNLLHRGFSVQWTAVKGSISIQP